MARLAERHDERLRERHIRRLVGRHLALYIALLDLPRVDVPPDRVHRTADQLIARRGSEGPLHNLFPLVHRYDQRGI